MEVADPVLESSPPPTGLECRPLPILWEGLADFLLLGFSVLGSRPLSLDADLFRLPAPPPPPLLEEKPFSPDLRPLPPLFFFFLLLPERPAFPEAESSRLRLDAPLLADLSLEAFLRLFEPLLSLLSSGDLLLFGLPRDLDNPEPDLPPNPLFPIG